MMIFAIHQHGSAIEVYMCPLPLEPPYPLPPCSTTVGCHRALALGSLLYTANYRWLSILHMVIYMFQCSSLKSSHPLILPLCPKSVLYICVSFAALQYYLSRFHIYALIYHIYLSLSDLLHSV